MRAVPAELNLRLAAGATTLCRCWAIDRPDGMTLGFTDHDTALSFEGIRFAASSGLDAGAIERSAGLSVDNSLIRGALSADAVTAEDLRAGRYDGARIRQWLVDWTRPDLRVLVFDGTLGEARESGQAFEVELRGLAEPLNRPVGRVFMRLCDRTLGDSLCGVDASEPPFAHAVTVLSVDSRSILVSGGGNRGDDWFRHGIVSWTQGANAGLVTAIRRDRVEAAGRRLELADDPAAPIVAGDMGAAIAGCDKKADTCRKKFNNIMNFRGFPHLPKDDWVVAYPEAGGRHDGGPLEPSQ